MSFCSLLRLNQLLSFIIIFIDEYDLKLILRNVEKVVSSNIRESGQLCFLGFKFEGDSSQTWSRSVNPCR